MTAGGLALRRPLAGPRPADLAAWLAARPLAVALAVALVIGLPTGLLTVAGRGAAEAQLVAQATAAEARLAAAGAGAVADTLRQFQTRLLTVAESRLAQVGATRGDRALLATVLQEFRPLLPGTRTLHYADATGALLAADPPSAAYAAPLQSAAMSQAPVLDPAALAVALAAPVRDGFGAQVGVLVGTIALRDLLDAAAASSDPSAYLVEPGGRLVVRTAEGAVLRDAAGTGSGAAELISASAPVSDLGWRVVVSRPRAELAAQLAAAASELLAFRLALIAALAAAAYLVARIARDLVLERRALAASSQRLAVASRHKTEFLANVNHELRTPLSSILGFAALLEERTGLEPRQIRYVRNIRAAGDQLLGLVDDILDLAAVETGTLALSRERVPVERILTRPLSVARGIAEARDLRLESDIPASGAVLVDPRRLEHALTLLVASACDATPAGGLVGIAVSLDHGDLVIALADGGPAVARERAARVFEVYGRIREGGSGPSGPGLALAKRLVELHGGTVFIEGGDGSGGVITVRLPGAVVPA